jgi:uncharacterized protein (DUF2342 family)
MLKGCCGENCVHKRLKDLRQTDSRRWWHVTKQMTGQSSSQCGQLSGLANQLTGGDFVQLAKNINGFFHSVSSGLQPLDASCLSTLSDTDTVPDKLVIEPYMIERLL